MVFCLSTCVYNAVQLKSNVSLEHLLHTRTQLEFYSCFQAWIQLAASQLIYNTNFYETKLFKL